jgi:DNA polymerase III delta' subunit
MDRFKQITGSVKNKNNGSFLFYGVDGVGKRYHAVLLARTILCMEPDINNGPCGSCQNCIRIERNIHPNLIIIEPEGKDIKIEVIRELIQELNFAPPENGKRFIIIDDAHRMNDSSANALLKTLEEPPKNTYFVLLTSNLKRIPATILSRCEMFRFSPLSDERIAGILGLPGDNALLPYSLGSVSRLSFYLANAEEILGLIDFMKKPAPSYKAISAIVAGLLDKTPGNTETFEYLSSLILHLICEHIEQRALQGLDYSGILECVERLKSMNAAFYLNSQPSIVLENMLLDAARVVNKCQN